MTREFGADVRAEAWKQLDVQLRPEASNEPESPAVFRQWIVGLGSFACRITFATIDHVQHGIPAGPMKRDIQRPHGVLCDVGGKLAEDKLGGLDVGVGAARGLEAGDELVPRASGCVPIARLKRPAMRSNEVQNQDCNVVGSLTA